MDITLLDAGVVGGRRRSGDFDAVFAEPWPGDFGSESPMGYHNPEVATLLQRAEATLNPRGRDAIYRELWPIFIRDVPVTYLYPVARTTVAHRRVRGLSSPWHDDPRWYADRLWLEDEERPENGAGPASSR
jgi:ABC-type transport system substrate-binding protein